MTKCNYCGSRIILGGVKDGAYRYCNENCHQNGIYLAVADKISPALLADQIVEVHQGKCPCCGGQGPVDVQSFHQIWSAIVVSTYTSKSAVCCRVCGIQKKVGAIFFSFFLGWWGIPWGILITPIQIIRNIVEFWSVPDPQKPSERLEQVVKITLAQQLYAQTHQPTAPAGTAR